MQGGRFVAPNSHYSSPEIRVFVAGVAWARAPAGSRSRTRARPIPHSAHRRDRHLSGPDHDARLHRRRIGSKIRSGASGSRVPRRARCRRRSRAGHRRTARRAGARLLLLLGARGSPPSPRPSRPLAQFRARSRAEIPDIGARHHLAGKCRTRCTTDDGQKENGTSAAFIAPVYFSAGWRCFSISGASSMEGISPGTSLTFAASS